MDRIRLTAKTEAARDDRAAFAIFGKWKLDYGHNHGHNPQMKTVSKARLKAGMLGMFREVERTGVPLVVTDHGRPVLKVLPYEPGRLTPDEAFADVRGKVRYRGDLLAPTTSEWSET